MKKVGFIGAYDKIDLIIYVAKILTTLNKKVLVIDATTIQKARYVVPAINPTITYVTEYEGIDIAVGFQNIQDIKRYLGISEKQELEYDIVLIDTDNIESFKSFKLEESFKNYFVSSFDATFTKILKDIISESSLLFRTNLKPLLYCLIFILCSDLLERFIIILF